MLPIMQSMRRPDAFPRVVRNSFIFITVLNVAFGAVCYGIFRDQTEGNILANLGNGPMLKAVKILLMVDLLFTAPIVLSACREVVETTMVEWLLARGQPVHSALEEEEEEEEGKEGGHGPKSMETALAVEEEEEGGAAGAPSPFVTQPLRENRGGGAAVAYGTGLQSRWFIEFTRYAVRTVLVAIIFSIALAVPNFGNAVTLVGGFGSCSLGFIIPPLLHIRVSSVLGRPLKLPSLLMHVGIIIFGVVAMVVSTYFTMKHIIAGK